MEDYEKMSDTEIKDALADEGFSNDEIKEILKKCRTRTNQCINEQKTKIRNKKKEKDKADSKRNTENVKNFNAQTQKSTIPKL